MTDQFIKVRGLNIRYRDTGRQNAVGAGTPIIVTHGIGGSLELWTPQLEGLGKTHRIIAWDVPNHGLSDLTGQVETWETYAQWLLDFADALKLDQFIAAGNSMGGALSLRVAALAPARVKGIFLANAASFGPDVFPVFKLMTLPLLGEVMNKPSEKGLDMQLGAIVKDPSCVDAALRTALLRNLHKQGGAKAFLATLRATTTLLGQRKSAWGPSHNLLASLTLPMAILHGRQDAVVPLKHSEAAAKMAKNAELIVLEDCGHTPQIEKPAEFNAALAEFAGKLKAA